MAADDSPLAHRLQVAEGFASDLRRELESACALVFPLASVAAAHERLIAEQSFALHRIWCAVRGVPVIDGPLPEDVSIDVVVELVSAKWQTAHEFAAAFAPDSEGS